MVTEEEVEQLAAMINWALTERGDILSVRLDCFNQYSSKTKKKSFKASLTFLKEKPNNHVLIGGDGNSVTEAMQLVSNKL